MSDAKAKRGPREVAKTRIPPVDAVTAVALPAIESTATPAAETVPQAPAAAATAPQPPPAMKPKPVAMPVPRLIDSRDEPWTELAKAQALLTGGIEEIIVEVADVTRSGIAIATDAAVALIGARTVPEAIEINSSLAQQGVDALLRSAARLTAISARMFGAAGRPRAW